MRRAVPFLLAAFFAPASALAQTQVYVPVQGVLTDASGEPLVATVSMTFSVYADATTATALWREVQMVQVGAVFPGVYSARLGAVTALSAELFRDNPGAQFGIRLGTDTADVGRWPLDATPKSAHSALASSASMGGANQAQLDPIYVNVAGDTMTGPLVLPQGGLRVGTQSLVVDTAGRVGVGTTTPVAALHVRTPDSYTEVHIEGYSNLPGGWSGHRIKRARGTAAAPARTLDGDILWTLHPQTWTGTDFQNSGYLSFTQDGAYTMGAAPVKFEIGTLAGVAVTVRNDLRVGIGTAAPAQRLHVNGAVRADGGLCMGVDCRTSWAAVTADVSPWDRNGTAIMPVNAADLLAIGHRSTVHNLISMRSGGPTEAIELHSATNHDARTFGARLFTQDAFGGTGSTPLVVQVQEGATWRNAAYFSHGNADGHPALRTYNRTYLATDGGNVGIGTTSPAYKLTVLDTATTLTTIYAGNAGTGGRARFQLQAQGNEGYWEGERIGAPANNFAMKLFTEGTDGVQERLRVVNNGNVGIGTTTPAGKVQIYDATPAQPPLGITRGYDGARIRMQYAATSNYGEIGMVNGPGTFSTADTDLWIGANLDSTGASHVTSPRQSNAVASSWITRWNTRAGDNFQIGRIAPGGNQTMATFFQINASGNVGINNASPIARLDVGGDLRVRGIVANDVAAHSSGGPGSDRVVIRKGVFAFMHPTGGYASGQEWAQRWYHIRTPDRGANSEMFRYDANGYSYGISQPISFTWVGYLYSATPTQILDARAANNTDNGVPCSQYIGSDGALYLKFGPMSQYYNTFVLDYQSGSTGERIDHGAGGYTVTLTTTDVTL